MPQDDDKLETGGVTFDGAALDALLDEDPTVSADRPSNDYRTDVVQLPEQPAAQDDRSDDDLPRDEDGSEVHEIEGESTADDAEEGAVVDERDDETGDRRDDQVEESFITDGDEGPMLLTGVGEDGKPIYETAEQLFGDHQFHIKAAGEDHTVTFNEMRQGYQRQADYTRAKTEVVQAQRTLQPFLGLINMWNESDSFRDVVTNYLEGAREGVVSDEALMEAFDSGDRDKVNSLLEKKKSLEKRRQAYDIASKATQEQQKAFAMEQRRIAETMIENYSSTIPNVKTFLQTLGYGDNEVDGLEYADARLQNLAYLAWLQANPNSSQAIPMKTDQRTLQSKRKRIVKRPPKTISSGPVTSNTPSASNTRKTKEAFRKAYKSRRSDDFQKALEYAIPEDLLED